MTYVVCPRFPSKLDIKENNAMHYGVGFGGTSSPEIHVDIMWWCVVDMAPCD